MYLLPTSYSIPSNKVIIENLTFVKKDPFELFLNLILHRYLHCPKNRRSAVGRQFFRYSNLFLALTNGLIISIKVTIERNYNCKRGFFQKPIILAFHQKLDKPKHLNRVINYGLFRYPNAKISLTRGLLLP